MSATPIRDFSSFQGLTEKQSDNRKQQVRSYSERMVREQVKAEALTGNEEWDLFLSYVQGLIGAAEKAKLAVDIQLCDAPVFDDLELRRLKSQSMLIGERLFALNQILHIPVLIINEGRKGLDALASLQGTEDSKK